MKIHKRFLYVVLNTDESIWKLDNGPKIKLLKYELSLEHSTMGDKLFVEANLYKIYILTISINQAWKYRSQKSFTQIK